MSRRFSIFTLSTLNIFLLCTLLIQACKKDTFQEVATNATISLTVDEAKQFFELKTQSKSVSMRDSTSEPLIIPDWNHAVSYFDTIKQQSVVEAPPFNKQSFAWIAQC